MWPWLDDTRKNHDLMIRTIHVHADINSKHLELEP
jgi:hypothetical protein